MPSERWSRAWDGHWIGLDAPTPSSGGAPQWHGTGGGDFARILFQRRFDLDAVPEEAPMRITADSRYLLLVNGTEAGRGPVRSQPRRLHHDEHDLAPLLQPGTNTLIVLVTYYGTANSYWQPAAFNETLGRVGVLVAEARIGDRLLVTDDRWEARAATAWSAAGATGIDGVPVEVLDARLLDADWRAGGGDGWAPAHVLPATHIGSLARSRPPTDPYGPLLPRPIGPLGGEIRLPVAAALTRAADLDGNDDPSNPAERVLRHWPGLGGDREAVDPGAVRFAGTAGASRGVEVDFGRIVAGLVGFGLEAPAGTLVDLLYREKPPRSDDAAAFSTPRTGARYVARGSDDRFEALETNGLRYATLLITTTTAGDVVLSGLHVREHLHQDGGGAFFSSSDRELDRLYTAGRRTVELNAHDAYTDCPTREQRSWVGDGVVHQSVHLTTHTDWRMARWYVELGNSPRPDGILPMSVVGEIEHSGATTIPDWSLYWIRGVRNLVDYTGDRDAVSAAAPTARRILEWYLPYLTADGALADVPEWNLVDWSSVVLTGASSILTALWARGLQDYAAIARFLDDDGGAAWAERLHAVVRAGFDLFWDGERGAVVDSFGDGAQLRPASQLAGATAICAGLLPADRVGSVLAWISDPARQVVRSWIGGDGGYDQRKIVEQMSGVQRVDWDADEEVVVAEPFAAHLVHDAYRLAGRPDLVVSSMRRWSAFLVDGYDTFGECWGWGTPVHGWSATPTRDLVTTVLGVVPDEAGFAVARVAPAYGLVERIDAAVPTPQGLLSVRIDGRTAEVDSPVPFVLVAADGTETRFGAGRGSGA